MFTKPRLFVVGLAIALAWLAVLHSVAMVPETSADAIYPLTLAKDVAQHGLAGISWMTPPANGLIPDVVITTVALVLGFDGFANFSAFYASYVLMLFASCWFFLRSSESKSPYFAPAVAAFTVTALVLCWPGSEFLTTLYLSPDHHQAALVVTLLTLGLYLRPESSGRLGLMCLVMALGTFSDPITIAQAVAPVLVLCLLDRRPRPAVACLAAAAIGFGLRHILTTFAPLEYGGNGTDIHRAFQSTLKLFRGFADMLDAASAGRGWLGVAALVGLSVAARKSRPARALAVATVIAVLAPGLVGSWVGPALFRQQLPLFFFPVFGVISLGAEALARRWHRLPMAIGGLGLAVPLILNSSGLPLLFGPDPMLRRQGEVTRALEAHGVHVVAATYWAAKPVWLHGNGALIVCQLDGGGRRQRWIVDVRWCDEFMRVAPSEPVVAVVSEAPWRDDLAQAYGESSSREVVDDYEIRYYTGEHVRAVLATRW